jgi:hypothetical protein
MASYNFEPGQGCEPHLGGPAADLSKRNQFQAGLTLPRVLPEHSDALVRPGCAQDHEEAPARRAKGVSLTLGARPPVCRSRR